MTQMELENFKQEVEQRKSENFRNTSLKQKADEFRLESIHAKYSYNFSWLGRPIIQYPQDVVAIQEIIWRVQPDLIIETGIAHGGSLILSASILELIAVCGGRQDSHVLGIDIDIRKHNRDAIEKHPLNRRISMIEGSSIDQDIVSRVRDVAAQKTNVMVFLDSSHTHDHVIAELHAYAELVSVGSYCVVFDTLVEEMPSGTITDRPWDVGNNPMTAVDRFLEGNDQFEVDTQIDGQLMVTVAPRGYLQRVRP